MPEPTRLGEISSDDVLRGRVSAPLDAVVREGVSAGAAIQAEEHRARQDLMTTALKPFAERLADSPESSEAMRKLAQLDSSPGHLTRPASNSLAAPAEPNLNISAGTTFFTPPFDYALEVTSGPGASGAVDPVRGRCEVSFRDGEFDGAFFVTCGFGISLQTRTTGVLAVRPLVNLDYSWGAQGYYLSSHVKGHFQISAAAESGAAVTGSATYELFNVGSNNTNSGGVRQTGEVRFLAHKDEQYQVFFTIDVSGDQSGSYAFGYSIAGAVINANVPLVVADLQPL